MLVNDRATFAPASVHPKAISALDLLVLAAAAVAAAQDIPVLSKPDDSRFPLKNSGSAPVQVESHPDLMGPDCKVSSNIREGGGDA